jgi:hypothetical protein
MGKMCERHQEWCPTGECRWCAPTTARAICNHDKAGPCAFPPLPVEERAPAGWPIRYGMTERQQKISAKVDVILADKPDPTLREVLEAGWVALQDIP